jgi:enoyl-CoA hydratase/carnithine racemase
MALIEYKKQGRTAIFSINRPDKLNVLNVQTMTDLTESLLAFRDDDELWVGIITGTGEMVMSAGVDINDYLNLVKESTAAKWRRPAAIMRGMDLWKPMIAACNGLTIGGGLEMSLACDLMIAADNATFALPEVKLGICPGGGGTVRLPRTIPRRFAAEMLFTGKAIDAREAYRIGLVNRVVPGPQLMESALALAEEICGSAPLAVRGVKEAMVRTQSMSLDEALRLEDDIETFLLSTEDCREGFSAFAERRSPDWKGK